MKRIAATILLLASACYAETIFVTPTGKTYHKVETCAVLKRSPKTLRAEKAVAESHGLKPCRSCYGAHKATNAEWAKEK
jgi:hypothetical protein